MKNVREIKSFVGDVSGAVMAMECGAILETDGNGEGVIRYQGVNYHATKEQCDAYISLPQVSHLNRGRYYIKKRMRYPWGDVTLYQDDKFRAKDI